MKFYYNTDIEIRVGDLVESTYNFQSIPLPRGARTQIIGMTPDEDIKLSIDGGATDWRGDTTFKFISRGTIPKREYKGKTIKGIFI